MNATTLKEAINAAQDFLKQAKLVEVRTYTASNGKKYDEVVTGKETAATKRKSMDLSHALVALRKSG